MKPSNGIDPFAPLAMPIHWLAGTSVDVIAGLAAGFLLSAALRALNLRWTWAAAAFGATVLVAPDLGGLSLALLSAGGCATYRCRAREQRELAAGMDLAASARQRRGPLQMLAMLAREVRRVGSGSEATELRDGELTVVVGTDADSRCVRIPIGGRAGGVHTLVVGAAGSGKTVTETLLACRAIEQGLPVVVVDPKEDGNLHAALSAAAEAAGRRLLQWSPDGDTVFNPFANGSETEIADKLLAGERFTEPHYLRQAQRFLGYETRALRAAKMQLSLRVLAEHLDPAKLEQLARGLAEQEASPIYDYLDSLTERQRRELSGVRDRISIVAESDVGRWLDPATEAAPQFDLLSAIESGSVVLFRLRSDRRPLLMRMLGSAIVADLSTTMACLQGETIPWLAVIDEFAALAASEIGGLFARARAAGMSLVLGTQELSDLELDGREGLERQVLGNLTTTIAHRQVVPESAETISKLAGCRGAWRRSLSSGGRSTEVRVRERILPPETVRALPRGCAAVIVHAGPCAGVSLAAIRSSAPKNAAGRRQEAAGRGDNATGRCDDATGRGDDATGRRDDATGRK